MNNQDLKHLKEIFVVTAAQMRDVESRIFAAGMPIPALVEKVGRLICDRLLSMKLKGSEGVGKPPEAAGFRLRLNEVTDHRLKALGSPSGV